MRDIVFILGNGICIDYTFSFPELEYSKIDSSAPFSFDIDDFPEIQEAYRSIETKNLLKFVCQIRKEMPELNDFQIIDVIVKEKNKWREIEGLEMFLSDHYFRLFHDSVQRVSALRDYLCLFYSQSSTLFDKEFCRDWVWSQKVLLVKDRIGAICGLNYDMTIETILEKNAIDYSVVFEDRPFAGIPLIKPHGSVSFRLNNVEVWASRGCIVSGQNSSVRLVNRDELFNFRENNITAEIVLPTQASEISHFQFIHPGFEVMKSRIKKAKIIVMGGISYWDVDRPEIDLMLSWARSTAKIYVVNPTVNDHLQKTVSDLGLKLTHVSPQEWHAFKL